MKESVKIELLAPARNLDCGREAIIHGADAVYIGASRFGARAAAGNSIEDIAELVHFAHIYHARVYVTVNTILKDSELSETEALIWQLYEIGVDAILVQDMAVLRMHLPPIALHASTQMDVRSVEKVRFLAQCGFSRAVLARELSLDEIRAIHDACPDIELECFVHGALCVSYSGQCYASEHCFGRSANRGECAQFCRLPFDLVDSSGNVLIHDKHLLSLKDMRRIESLEELVDAGVVSLKIEGRLKDMAYVKNVTSAYSLKLNSIIGRRSDLIRSSSGEVSYYFEPNLSKSFNRGFTDYFLHGEAGDICAYNSPKSIGEFMGVVTKCGPGWLAVNGGEFHNGDGICLSDVRGEMRGCRVNKVESDRLYLFADFQHDVSFPTGTAVYRNYDKEFDRLLSGKTAERSIPVRICFYDTDDGFRVQMTDTEGNSAEACTLFKHQVARVCQTDNICTQLSRLGGTVFRAQGVTVDMSGDWFVPSSLLSEMRRNAVSGLYALRQKSMKRLVRREPEDDAGYPAGSLTYLGNVMNDSARSFYLSHGVRDIADAYEMRHRDDAAIMFCRHCIRRSLGWCSSKERKYNGQGALFLKLSDGRLFRLEFDCRNCRMMVIPASPKKTLC